MFSPFFTMFSLRSYSYTGISCSLQNHWIRITHNKNVYFTSIKIHTVYWPVYLWNEVSNASWIAFVHSSNKQILREPQRKSYINMPYCPISTQILVPEFPVMLLSALLKHFCLLQMSFVLTKIQTKQKIGLFPSFFESISLKDIF